MLSFCFGACSKDEEATRFVSANDELVSLLESTSTLAEARRVFEENKENVGERFSAIADARGFQFSEEMARRMGVSVSNGVVAVCALEIRAAFRRSEANGYQQLCEEYAVLIGGTPSTERSTDRWRDLEEDFRRDVGRAREQAVDVERMLVTACVLSERYRDAFAEGAGDELAELYDEYHRLCTYDAPMNRVRAGVEAAESQVGNRIRRACYSRYASSVDELRRVASGQPEALSLLERWDAACPSR